MQVKPTIRKQPADSVRYGKDISTTGKWVYCAYDGDALVCVAATADEARRAYNKVMNETVAPEAPTWRLGTKKKRMLATPGAGKILKGKGLPSAQFD